jgi:hypothetical protein
MGSNRSKVITDIFGRNIRIAKERLNHILMIHPEMKEFKDKIGDILKNPEYIKRSKYDHK